MTRGWLADSLHELVSLASPYGIAPTASGAWNSKMRVLGWVNFVLGVWLIAAFLVCVAAGVDALTGVR